MTHDCGHVVYVFRTWLIVMSHGFHACDPVWGTWLVSWILIGYEVWRSWLVRVSWWISHYDSLWVMSCVTRGYQSCRVRVEARTPIQGHPRGMGIGSRTISSTHPAIEISTPREFIVNIHLPPTLSELRPHSPWAVPPSSRLTSLIMSLGPGILVSRGRLALLPPLSARVSLPRLPLAWSATPSCPCHRWLGP